MTEQEIRGAMNLARKDYGDGKINIFQYDTKMKELEKKLSDVLPKVKHGVVKDRR
jgi:hypothetical protein